jgi:hypothetical protein
VEGTEGYSRDVASESETEIYDLADDFARDENQKSGWKSGGRCFFRGIGSTDQGSE